MKYLFIRTLMLGMLLPGCSAQLKTASGLPACIEALISAHRNDVSWEIGHIEEYRFRENRVYALYPDVNLIADAAIMIHKADCSILCTIGGFRVEGGNACDNFFKQAVLVKKVWQKQPNK